MNVYDSFFRGITPDEWEFFAADFLMSIGFTISLYPSRGADGGKDFLADYNGIHYVVSCKHFISSGKAVGPNEEQSISDRLIQHGANGFIGFYSTQITTALSNRLEALKADGKPYIIYDKDSISNFLPKISSFVLQKYGLPVGIKYHMNVDKCDYKPLLCMGCGVDILSDDYIPFSMALICENRNSEIEYIYGCKSCCAGISELGWIEVTQALHLEQMNGWNRYVEEVIHNRNVSYTFYKNMSAFSNGIQQRMYPANWGRWLA